jgi:hypothetical protein
MFSPLLVQKRPESLHALRGCQYPQAALEFVSETAIA